MANKRIIEINGTATSANLTDNDYAVVDNQDSGTRRSKLSELATWIHNKWAAFINALTAKTSFASGDKIPVVNGSTATAMEADTLLELTAQNALAGNVAPAFIPNFTTTVAGQAYMYKDSLYVAKEDYKGPWDASKFEKNPLSLLVERNRQKIEDDKEFSDIVDNISVVEITESGYISTSGSVVDIGSVVSNAQFIHKVVDCVGGEDFTISGTGGSTPRLWCFIDSEENVLAKAGDTETSTYKTITAPEDSAKLVVNCLKANDHFLCSGIFDSERDKRTNAEFLKVETAIDLTREEIGVVQEYTQFDSGYIATNGTTVDPSTVVASSSWENLVIDCYDGDKFSLTCLGGDTARAWCFIDESNNVLASSVINSNIESETIFAPDNAKKIIINNAVSNESRKVVKLGNVKTLQKKQSRVGYVWEYGAVGNGTKDDTNAIVSAIANNDIIVFGKDKTYAVTNVIVQGMANKTLIGNGSTLKSTITTFSSSGRDVLCNFSDLGDETTDFRNGFIRVFDLGFDGNSNNIIDDGNNSANWYNCVSLRNFAFVLFQNCRFKYAANSGLSTYFCDKVIVDGCTFEHIGLHAFNRSTWRAEGIAAQGFINKNGSPSTRLYNKCSLLEVKNCLFDDILDTPAYGQNIFKVCVHNNVMKNLLLHVFENNVVTNEPTSPCFAEFRENLIINANGGISVQGRWETNLTLEVSIVDNKFYNFHHFTPMANQDIPDSNYNWINVFAGSGSPVTTNVDLYIRGNLVEFETNANIASDFAICNRLRKFVFENNDVSLKSTKVRNYPLYIPYAQEVIVRGNKMSSTVARPIDSLVNTYCQNVSIADNILLLEAYNIIKVMYDSELTIDVSKIDIANNFVQKLTTSVLNALSDLGFVSAKFNNSDYATQAVVWNRGESAITLSKEVAVGNVASANTHGSVTITTPVVNGNSFN